VLLPVDCIERDICGNPPEGEDEVACFEGYNIHGIGNRRALAMDGKQIKKQKVNSK
jgi:hypothetical protein